MVTTHIQAMAANDVDDALARRINVLLGRAFTDQRHTDRYTPEDHAALDAHVTRVHASAPDAGELMPADWLANFPTVRNFERRPAERREAWHFIVERDGYTAAHASLWAQHFLIDDAYINGGYIEDVATDPLHLGEGLASEAMRAAQNFARQTDLDILGLATGIGAFYERLGWQAREGSHLFSVLDMEYPDEPLMLLPLTSAGEDYSRRKGPVRSRRLWRFGEIPDDWPGNTRDVKESS